MTNYPRGKLKEDDQGELAFKMYWNDETFIIDFGKDVKWIGMSRKEAQEFGLRILRMTANAVITKEIPDDPTL